MENKQSSSARADFILIVDSTASMSGCIDGLKRNLGKFVEALTTEIVDESTQSSFQIKDWNGRLLIFRDMDVDGEGGMVNDLPFVNEQGALQTQLNDPPLHTQWRR
jgi:hypothetical protein